MQSTVIKLMQRFLRTFLLAIGIWCIGGVFGWWFQPAGSEISQEGLKAWTAMLTRFDATKIILNNLQVMTISLAGIFTGGVTSALTLLFNGCVAVLFLKNLNILELPCAVKYRFSYVVFEICALWMSSAVGLLGFSQVFKLFTNSRFLFLYKELVFIITVYFISIVLTVIAGVLEADLITMLTTQR